MFRGWGKRSTARQSKPVRDIRARRQLLSRWVGVFCLGLLILVVSRTADHRFLMPGPISSVHSTVSTCSDCHSAAEAGPIGWIHAAFSSSTPRKEASACLICHDATPAAMDPHGIAVEKLKAYTRRLEQSGAVRETRLTASVRNALLPASRAFSEGVYCATCHQEHNSGDDLATIGNDQCHGCHAVQFDSFATNHPDFGNYPFERRTRINFDHGSHFGKHFPESLKKAALAKAVPKECASCHTAGTDRGRMDVKPFAQVCAACHLGQITGSDRATGPKGIALISLPGIDIETLTEKGAAIGKWPSDAEGDITPFMRLLIALDANGQKLLAETDELDMLDLTNANEAQIEAVERLAWEVKHLLHALTTAPLSAVLRRLGLDAEKDRTLIAALTASMPRDVLIGAQRDWMPGLQNEIDEDRFRIWMERTASRSARRPAAAVVKALLFAPLRTSHDGPAVSAEQKLAQAEIPIAPVPPGSWSIDPFGRLLKGGKPAEDEETEAEEPSTDAADSASPSPQDGAREAKADDSSPEGENAAAPQHDTPSPPLNLALDAESWAESGGWYRDGFAIYFRPTGHADPFFRAWLDFAADRHDLGETAAVFSHLTDKDAQGQCTKCHSVDASGTGERRLNWQPNARVDREAQFTHFDHRTHFSTAGKKGCLGCHELSGAQGYQDAFKGEDPSVFVSNFKAIRKETCASCHGGKSVREDCLLCHQYHAGGMSTPVIQTRIPANGQPQP